MKKERTAAETEEYLKEGLESGRIKKDGFLEEALEFDVEYLKSEEENKD